MLHKQNMWYKLATYIKSVFLVCANFQQLNSLLRKGFKKSENASHAVMWLVTCNFNRFLLDIYFLSTRNFEWGWTARIAIARHAIARHFWQEINCSSLARINWIRAVDKKSVIWHFLMRHINWKSQFFSYRNGK